MVVVKSITPVSDNELNLIREIFEQGEDVEAALYNRFPYAFHHISSDGTIYFGAHSYDYTYEICLSHKGIHKTE